MSSGFSKTGLSGLTNTLGRYRNPQNILDSIMVKLCKIGVEAISEAYSDTNGTGSSMASVYYEKNGSTWEIVAESEGILYLEFGAGITRNPDGAGASRNVLDKINTGGVSIADIGSYGLGKGSLHSWYAPPLGRHTTGTKSRHGFADAITAIYANLDNVIKKELDKE